jgi:2-polyprenyl-3-methyl-5-hydroxy-6-metoxy-1,4-benzoquinol methylase
MANTQYQLEGNAPQLYERETVHTLGRPLAELMFAYVALHAGDRVLDAACGTGIVTRVAAQRFSNLAHIIGVDLNPGMLDVARANTPTTGVPVAWRQGDAGALPFPDGRFEVVLCQQGLQFIPDQEQPCGRCAGYSCPGGALPARSLVRSPRITQDSRMRSPAMSVPQRPRVASPGIRYAMPRRSGRWWNTQGLAPSRSTSLRSCDACRCQRCPL